MKLAFLGNTYETKTAEVPTLETGKTGFYRGQPLAFRKAQTAPMPSKVLAYRGNSYIA